MGVKIEHLLSTMNYSGEALLEKMNIKTDIFAVNQVDSRENVSFQETTYRGAKVRILSLYERGIGLSRNTALPRARGDYLVISDDDVTYTDDYLETISRVIAKNPDADLIMFKIDRVGNDIRKGPEQIEGLSRIKLYNLLRYGAVNIVVRRRALLNNNINFDYNFGTKKFPGEDTVFIVDCYRAGLKMYSCSESIGTVDLSGSSWFEGYNEAYLKTRGALFYRLSPRWFWVLSLQFLIRKKRTYFSHLSFAKALRCLLAGRKEYQSYLMQ